MKKTIQTAATTARARVLPTAAAKSAADNDWEDELGDSAEAGVEWIEIATREKETSRIRRQMEARRELERRLEDKRLRDLVEDWAF